MKERLPTRYNPQEATRLWEVIPQSAKDVINCQYAIRNPDLTSYQREETKKLHLDLMAKLQEDPQAMQAYLNFKEIAFAVFGDMPPIPGIPHTVYERER